MDGGAYDSGYVMTATRRIVNRLDLSHRHSLGRGRRSRLIGAGAAVSLLVDGPQFMPAILDTLDRARSQILLEAYMIASDDTGRSVIDRLCHKASEGVDVRVVFDAIGSIRLSNADRRRMIDAGVRLRIFNRFALLRPFRTFFRTHRRIIVVDGQTGYVGGFGFSDEWTRSDVAMSPWHELVWQVRGAALREMIQAFSQGWHDDRPDVLPVQDVADGCAYSVMNKTRWGSTTLKRTIIRRFRRANHRIWLTTGYFVPGPLVRRVLARAARRGVDVRLMLTGPSDHPIVHYAGRRHYRMLLRAGVKIYETRRRMLHAKAAVVDDDLAAVGSSNLDNWSLRYNKEFNLAVISDDAVNELDAAMRDIQAQSTPITLEAWQRRPMLNRLLERCFGLADDLL